MGPRVLARSIDCRRGARSSDGLALLKFFGLTFALSWALWSLAGLVPVGTPLRTVLFLPGTFAPAIVALWLGGRGPAPRDWHLARDRARPVVRVRGSHAGVGAVPGRGGNRLAALCLAAA